MSSRTKSERRSLGLDDERGQTISMLIIILAVPLIAAAGLAYDGSRFLAAQREANDVALQAARAGAQAISADSLYSTGAATLDEGSALIAVDSYLAARGYSGSVAVSPTAVTVQVSTSHTPSILGVLPGIGTRSFTGTGTAILLTGAGRP